MPTALRQALPEISRALANLLQLQSAHPAQDGSVRWLLALNDGQTVETVGLPRDGVCVSSQVGYAVGCVFCMTGRDGLIKQVGSAEMVAQVVFARQHRPVKKVVFMGMGEPLLNYKNLILGIEKITGKDGLGISPKRITVSTSGISKLIIKMADENVKFNLAISLHSALEKTRNKIMPFSKKFPLDELKEAVKYWYKKTRKKICNYSFFWLIKKNFNIL